MWEDEKYRRIGMTLSLPFGLTLAPRFVPKMMASVIRYLRLCSLRMSIYIDDLILMCQSYKESVEEAKLLVDTLHNLGFGIHEDNAHVVPSKSAEFSRHTSEQ